jgi:uncharacterized protein YbjT (DUF2867 family)
MNAPHKIAVTGATGRVGRHVVDVLTERGVEVVPMSRTSGVDLFTGDGTAEALAGVPVVIDCAAGASADPEIAMHWFTTSAANLQRYGEAAGVGRIVVVSIIGCDRFTGGYPAATFAHERALQAGPIPVDVVRAAQFHEFVEVLLGWSTQGDTGYAQKMRTQLVAGRTVAETLVDVATGERAVGTEPLEVAGPREETMAGAAQLVASRRGHPLKIEEVSDPADPDRERYEGGGLLPGPDAILGGPTFEAWLAAQD